VSAQGRWRSGRVNTRRKRALAEKESQRWLSTTQTVAERAAAQVIVVGDRESEIFAVFARPPPGVEVSPVDLSLRLDHPGDPSS
jgi:hypothetical protein